MAYDGQGDNLAPAGGPAPLKYTTMTGVSGAIQTKNMSSVFMKDDSKNSYWSRRINNADLAMKEFDGRKRRRFEEDGSNEHLAIASSERASGMSLANILSDGTLPPSVPDVKGKGREALVCWPKSESLETAKVKVFSNM